MTTFVLNKHKIGNSVSNYFYFNKGQRRGIILFMLIVIGIVFFKWIL